MSHRQQTSCHVGGFPDVVKEHIRQDVCQTLPVQYKIMDAGYCLLHAPTADKNQAEFGAVFHDRISRGYSHFEAIVCPIPIDFSHSQFALPLNFKDATFLSTVSFFKARVKYLYFDSATFHGRAQFHRSSFSEVATFTDATFHREAWFTGSHFKSSTFDRVTFAGWTQFNSGAKFIEATDFRFTKFLAKTEFDTATFECDVSFDEAEFGKNSQVSFLLSSFQSSVSFKKAVFAGYLNFEGGKEQDVFAYGSSLSLRNARLEAPEKVSFHNVRLRPNWFVDTDSRKFVFASVRWENDKGREINARDELAALENRGAAQHHGTVVTYRLLAIACRQLAENAETNNRFEEASMFRRLAMDTEWLEKKVRFLQWFAKLRKRFLESTFGKGGSEEISGNLLTDTLGKFRKSGEYLIHGLYRWTRLLRRKLGVGVVNLAASDSGIVSGHVHDNELPDLSSGKTRFHEYRCLRIFGSASE